uniref:Peptidase C1A papain C-terminal domain-containing protein n=1 Tax=Fagus sylvatica TaxID=28930 RepID=A0A2N9J8L0_FAGSY
MAQYGCTYKDNAEKERRLTIFKDNVEFIESFNSAGDRSYKLSINGFADQTKEEFQASRNGYKRSSNNRGTPPFKYENVTAVPTSIDWRKKGAVTPIKDQGQCGCCWAISVVAATEGITKIANQKLISLSEQELVDCDTSGEDQGCEGGLMDDAFKFIMQNKGLTTEANFTQVGSSQETGTELDHGVTAVGYGIAADGTKYWLVKNSWGTGWGEEGYIRMERDIDAKEGLCGIAMESSYPTA